MVQTQASKFGSKDCRVRPLAWVIATAFLCVSFAGCGDGRPARVPVSGQVLIDGKPLTYGSVQFLPPNARASYGKLDGEGRFSMTCFDNNDGVVPGKVTVVIDAAEPLSDTQTRWHAPKKYADHRTSGLTQDISGSEGNVTINLSWDGGRPFVEDES